MTLNDVRKAVHTLASVRVGRNALEVIVDWLDADGLSLDRTRQNAVHTILDAAWGAWAGSTREIIHDALEHAENP
jgi:hypothetical protein